MCVYYIYIINIPSTHKYIMITKTFNLNAINLIDRLTALVIILMFIAAFITTLLLLLK